LPPAFPLPGDAAIRRRLAQMLAADSRQTGDNATTDRLMLMLTRSCELRCSYCFVSLTEEGRGEAHPATLSTASTDTPPRGEMSETTARRAVDLLMTSTKPNLSLQFFGGEPTRRWDVLAPTLAYARAHPGRGRRTLAVQLTTNGLGFDTARLETLVAQDVTVQLSLDGAPAGNRFRRPFLLDQAAADHAWAATVAALRESGVRWFMNVTVPPAAVGELASRVADARSLGATALQLNYATGMRYSADQAQLWLRSLAGVLVDQARHPDLRLFNRSPGADPAPLCGDALCDVDGTLLQVGGIFHEHRWPALRRAYTHGHLDTATSLAGHRATLADLWRATRDALSPEDTAIFAGGMWLGAGSDLVARVAAGSA
jgi:hypothetical protein